MCKNFGRYEAKLDKAEGMHGKRGCHDTAKTVKLENCGASETVYNLPRKDGSISVTVDSARCASNKSVVLFKRDVETLSERPRT